MKNQSPEELSAELDLPSYKDRLPPFTEFLDRLAEDLKQTVATQSYLPYWEDLYREVHNQKGLSKLLLFPLELAQFFERFHEILLASTQGALRCANLSMAAESLRELAVLLRKMLEQGSVLDGAPWIARFSQLHIADMEHAERKIFSAFLPYNSEQTSKRWREVLLCSLAAAQVSDEIHLVELPGWKKNLSDVLDEEKPATRGILVYCTPVIPKDAASKLKISACIAMDRSSLAIRMKKIGNSLRNANIQLL